VAWHQAELRRRLQPVSETAWLDAQLLLAHLLGVNRSWILAHPESELTPEQLVTLENTAARLESGEPLPYLLGHWEFYGLDITVSPAALIPRPETELMVEQAIAWLRLRPAGGRVCDVGCGSGCVAVALAANLPGLQVTASDISPAAVELARHNVARHGLADRVQVVLADLLPETPAAFDLICANLPYIPSDRLAGLPVARWEPISALDGGPDGLDVIRRLLGIAPQRLAPDGLLLMEIEAGQGAATSLLARRFFPHRHVQVLPDLSGLDRLVRVAASSDNQI
jgi:release factor glutamine methyltransferase